MVGAWLKSRKVHLSGNQVMKDMNETLEGLILFVQRLLFDFQDEGWLL